MESEQVLWREGSAATGKPLLEQGRTTGCHWEGKTDWSCARDWTLSKGSMRRKGWRFWWVVSSLREQLLRLSKKAFVGPRVSIVSSQLVSFLRTPSQRSRKIGPEYQ